MNGFKILESESTRSLTALFLMLLPMAAPTGKIHGRQENLPPRASPRSRPASGTSMKPNSARRSHAKSALLHAVCEKTGRRCKPPTEGRSQAAVSLHSFDPSTARRRNPCVDWHFFSMAAVVSCSPSHAEPDLRHHARPPRVRLVLPHAVVTISFVNVDDG